MHLQMFEHFSLPYIYMMKRPLDHVCIKSKIFYIKLKFNNADSWNIHFLSTIRHFCFRLCRFYLCILTGMLANKKVFCAPTFSYRTYGMLKLKCIPYFRYISLVSIIFDIQWEINIVSLLSLFISINLHLKYHLIDTSRTEKTKLEQIHATLIYLLSNFWSEKSEYMKMHIAQLFQGILCMHIAYMILIHCTKQFNPSSSSSLWGKKHSFWYTIAYVYAKLLRRASHTVNSMVAAEGVWICVVCILCHMNG